MATVNLNLSFDSNQINISLASEEMIEFNKKWSKIIELFKGELFVEDGEGYLWLLASSDEELFKKFAEKNDWWCKSTQNSRRNFDAVKGRQKKEPIYTVQLSTGYDDTYPYVDTLSYLNTDTGKLSNDSGTISADRILNDTEGGYEDYDSDDD